jgi:hypothetical protein
MVFQIEKCWMMFFNFFCPKTRSIFVHLSRAAVTIVVLIFCLSANSALFKASDLKYCMRLGQFRKNFILEFLHILKLTLKNSEIFLKKNRTHPPIETFLI